MFDPKGATRLSSCSGWQKELHEMEKDKTSGVTFAPVDPNNLVKLLGSISGLLEPPRRVDGFF